MKRFLTILLLLLCGACTTTHQDTPAANYNMAGTQNDAMNDLAVFAISLADTSYRHGGDSPETGFDCSGFVRYVFQKSAGWILPRTSLEMSRTGESLEVDQLRPGDLVFFNTQKQLFSHVGIYVGEDRFVHAPSKGKAISLANMHEHYWQSRYDGARRINLPRTGKK
ncbi:MAG: C40 family peptidase [Gallionellaceae bacterium]|nr:C40 family peptidase [Gallionellaceae bacterium]